jgi:hypothetical protein
VVEKEARNLEVLHGQSDLSSWYFIERAEVGALLINVTVSLSSRLLSSAGRGAAAAATVKVRGAGRQGWVAGWPPDCGTGHLLVFLPTRGHLALSGSQTELLCCC